MGTTKKSKNQKIIKKQVNKAIKRIPLGIVICILIVGCIVGYLYYKKINDNKDSTNENNIKKLLNFCCIPVHRDLRAFIITYLIFVII